MAAAPFSLDHLSQNEQRKLNDRKVCVACGPARNLSCAFDSSSVARRVKQCVCYLQRSIRFESEKYLRKHPEVCVNQIFRILGLLCSLYAQTWFRSSVQLRHMMDLLFAELLERKPTDVLDYTVKCVSQKPMFGYPHMDQCELNRTKHPERS